MGNNRIATTDRSGLTVSQVGGNDIYKMLPQVRGIVERSNLGEDYVTLFAEPVDGGRSIDWYSDEDGEAVRVMELPAEEKQQMLQRFREMFEALHTYAGKLRVQGSSQTYKNYADILEKAIVVPGLDCLYSVQGRPVLVGWGFSMGDSDVVENGRKLIRQIERTLDEVSPVTQAKVEKSAEASAPSSEKAGEETEEEPASAAASAGSTVTASVSPVGAAVTPVAAPTVDSNLKVSSSAAFSQREDRAASAARKSSSFLPILLGALVVLAIAALVWFFLNRKDDSDFAFLKGETNVRGLLANEENHPVDLTLKFPGDDGRGESLIVEPSQTCRGSVTAQHGSNGAVVLVLSELVCPNGNNYTPFSLVCEKGESSCTGTNQNGDSWRVDVKFEGAAK